MSTTEITDLFELRSIFIEDADKAISLVYKYYRNAFMVFAKKITLDDNLIIDAFQEAVIALYQNLIENKISTNNCTVKTYLFEIGKHKLFNILRKENKQILTDDLKLNFDIYCNEIKNTDNEIIIKLSKALEKLGKTCQKLLNLYYYKKFSINAIMHTLDMKSENSVKSNKSRCIKNLKLLISKVLKS